MCIPESFLRRRPDQAARKSSTSSKNLPQAGSPASRTERDYRFPASLGVPPFRVERTVFEGYLQRALDSLGPKRLEVCRGTLSEELTNFLKTERGPDAPCFR